MWYILVLYGILIKKRYSHYAPDEGNLPTSPPVHDQQLVQDERWENKQVEGRLTSSR